VLLALFSGIGSALAVFVLSLLKGNYNSRVRMKAQQLDKSKAEDLDLREMVTTIYSAMVTPRATPFNRNPTPGLIDRVASIDERLFDHDRQLKELASALSQVAHRAALEVNEQSVERERVQSRDAGRD
jgi:hypothetical protein